LEVSLEEGKMARWQEGKKAISRFSIFSSFPVAVMPFFTTDRQGSSRFKAQKATDSSQAQNRLFFWVGKSGFF
jgi:hypothetical protein